MTTKNLSRDPFGLARIREVVVLAIASDKVLMERLVLKGGTALDLVHLPGLRSSLDVDYSMEDDFESSVQRDEVRDRLVAALERRFLDDGRDLFDAHFEARPPVPATNPRWGGYELTFKLSPSADRQRLAANLEARRREAVVVGPAQRRIFSVQISKHEHCAGKQAVERGGVSFFVYSPPMMVAEKLRALCQQLPDYAPIGEGRRRPRARDVFDLHELLRRFPFDGRDRANRRLVERVFSAKAVPFPFIGRIEELRDFMRAGWDDVILATAGALRRDDFDRHFDTVRDLAAGLHPARDA